MRDDEKLRARIERAVCENSHDGMLTCTAAELSRIVMNELAIQEHIGHDPVEHPAHYRRGGMEVIDVIEAFDLGFNAGNTVKYVLRAGHKGDRLEDLRKGRWYLDREIQRGESGR